MARSNPIEAEDLPPEVRGKGEEPMASVPKDSKELGRMKWQLKRKAENEVEKAFLKEALKRNKRPLWMWEWTGDNFKI